MQPGKAIEILAGDMLRMLDAKAPISQAVFRSNARIDVQNYGVCAVSNRVKANLDAGSVCAAQPCLHVFQRLHGAVEQAAAFRIVRVRLKEICCFRTKRTVGKCLHGTQAKVWTAKAMPDPELLLILILAGGRRRIYARAQHKGPLFH